MQCSVFEKLFEYSIFGGTKIFRIPDTTIRIILPETSNIFGYSNISNSNCWSKVTNEAYYNWRIPANSIDICRFRLQKICIFTLFEDIRKIDVRQKFQKEANIFIHAVHSHMHR